MKRIIGVRHGESYKNLENLYGGVGKTLTDKGVDQALNTSESIKGILQDGKSVIRMFVSTDRVQVLETAKILQDKLNISEVYRSEGFKPIRLGVLDGMSETRQMELYPDAIKAMNKWHDGDADVSEFKVEGLQDAKDYYEQTKCFLESLEDDFTYILVGTRSDMSVLKNVILGNDPLEYMSYKYYHTDYGESVIFDMDEKNNFHILVGLDDHKIKSKEDNKNIITI